MDYEGTKWFLKSRGLTDQLPLELNVSDCDNFINIQKKDKDSLLLVFGKISVAKYNVAAFFLQLFATKLLDCEWKGKRVRIILTRDEHDNLRYKNKMNWEGMLFKNTRLGIGYSFERMILAKEHLWHPGYCKSCPSKPTKKKNQKRKKKTK